MKVLLRCNFNFLFFVLHTRIAYFLFDSETAQMSDFDIAYSRTFGMTLQMLIYRSNFVLYSLSGYRQSKPWEIISNEAVFLWFQNDSPSNRRWWFCGGPSISDKRQECQFVCFFFSTSLCASHIHNAAWMSGHMHRFSAMKKIASSVARKQNIPAFMTSKRLAFVSTILWPHIRFGLYINIF